MTRRSALAAIVVLALAVRIVAAVGLGDTAAPVSGAFDQFTYDRLAQRVVDGHGFSFDTDWYPFTPAGQPTAHWSYLYTLYLAAVYEVFGHHPLAARLIQVVLSALSCLLLFRLGTRLFGPHAGLAAAALSSVYTYLVFFDAALMTQSFYILCLLAVMNLSVELVDAPQRRSWWWLGAALGVGALLRQTLLVFTPVLVVALALAAPERPKLRALLPMAAIIALCVLPFTWFNYVRFGDILLLNSNGGYFLFASNHPAQGVRFDPNFVAPMPAALDGLSEPQKDRALLREAIGFVVSDPWRVARLTASRLPEYFWLLPSSRSSTASNVARLVSFTLYAPFFVYGLYLSRRHWRRLLPIYAYLAFDTTLHLLSWSAPRYRLPSDALMMIFAGLAVESIVRRCRPTPPPRQADAA